MRQILFDSSTVEKCYLSPYAKISWNPRGAVLRQTVFEKVVFIQGGRDQVSNLLNELENGVSYTDLCGILQKEFEEMNPDNWIGVAFRSGVIE